MQQYGRYRIIYTPQKLVVDSTDSYELAKQILRRMQGNNYDNEFIIYDIRFKGGGNNGGKI